LTFRETPRNQEYGTPYRLHATLPTHLHLLLGTDMLRLRCGVLTVLASLAAPPVHGQAVTKVMVVGTYHFENPGADLVNSKADNVLTPVRQKQLDAVAAALLKFRPTVVMVEQESEVEDLSVVSYERFTRATLVTDANEITQIAFRVAKKAGLTKVYGIDEQPKAGEPDYFPFDRLAATAEKFGQQDKIENAKQHAMSKSADFETRQKTQTVGQLLLSLNTAESTLSDLGAYYGVLNVGDSNTQTGAELNAMWYLRNAKIYAKLMRVAKPGDRVLVLYGAGHNYWLRHFASQVQGHQLIDPVPYLQKATSGSVKRQR
jgi:hypothetical protein